MSGKDKYTHWEEDNKLFIAEDWQLTQAIEYITISFCNAMVRAISKDVAKQLY